MECFIVASSDVSPDRQTLILRDDEAHHAVRSLRIRPGELLMATDLEGTCYRCMFTQAGEQGRKTVTAECAILQVHPDHHESERSIILAQAILQQPSRFEEIVEKATELGITGIIPLTSARTEKEHINADRIERILREATKQVSRARKPSIADPVPLAAAIDTSIREGRLTIVLHEAISAHKRLAEVVSMESKAPVTLVIGPEGGFTEEEIAYAASKGAHLASLGTRRLRAETAAIASVSLVALLTS